MKNERTGELFPNWDAPNKRKRIAIKWLTGKNYISWEEMRRLHKAIRDVELKKKKEKNRKKRRTNK